MVHSHANGDPLGIATIWIAVMQQLPDMRLVHIDIRALVADAVERRFGYQRQEFRRRICCILWIPGYGLIG